MVTQEKQMKRYQILFLVPVLACAVSAANAEVVQLKCEYWHKRLGQLADKTYAIDFDAKTCNGQPCKITDAELKWTEEGGRMELTISRVTGEGTQLVLSEEIALYKSCSSAKPKA
jgi:hypothetical protein